MTKAITEKRIATIIDSKKAILITTPIIAQNKLKTILTISANDRMTEAAKKKSKDNPKYAHDSKYTPIITEQMKVSIKRKNELLSSSSYRRIPFAMVLESILIPPLCYTAL
jgi:hypothetical protein